MKTKFYPYILFMLILIGACKKLDEKIYTAVDSATFIKSESDAIAQLYGAYSYLTSYNGFKSLTTYPIMYAGDDVVAIGGVPGAFPARAIAASNAYFAGPWATFFQTIENANSMMQSLERANGISTEFKNRVMGELYFLRAFSYFYLVRLYGAVPIHTEPVTGSSDFYPGRNSVDEVYALIINDFKKASVLCLPYSEQPGGEFGRATKGAAQSMLSLAYLTYGNYQNLNNASSSSRTSYEGAKLYADSVINSNEYTLLSNYASLFDVEQEKNAYKEVIFGIQFTRDPLTASANARGSELAHYLQPASRPFISGNVTNGLGGGTLKVQPWFYDECRTGDYLNDYRTEVSFLTKWTNSLTSKNYVTYPEVKAAPSDIVEPYPYLNKYQDPKGLQSRNNENDLFIIRLAEVYLIKAEAENELNGPTPDAYYAFNMLRERARLANGTVRTTPANLTAGLTKEEFRLRIFKERGLELVGEGHRVFDYQRMRYIDNVRTMAQYRFEEYYPNLALKTAPAYNNTTNTWGGGRVNPTNIAPFSKKFLLFPIPSTEIDANSNPNMYQNPDW